MRLITRALKHKRRLQNIEFPAEKVAHKREKLRVYKKNADVQSLYAGKRWKKMRAIILARNPVCAACQAAPATDLDHIVPHKGDKALFFNLDNTQPLCRPCHQAKTAAERNARRRFI